MLQSIPILDCKTVEEVLSAAEKYSAEHPGMYVTVYSRFGAFLRIGTSLDIEAPHDSIGGCYFLNGKKKEFTRCQRLASEQAYLNASDK